MKRIFLLIIVLCFKNILFAIPVIPDDFIIFQKSDTGYDLYVKKMEGIESILITESQKDPQKKKTNYGLRTEKFHEANGNEIRILDDKKLETKYEVFFLVDSTTELYEPLGECFHFFLPEKVLYGYNWTRQGIIKIKPGIKLNLRKFEKKFTDYTGNFEDQWITLKIKYTESNFRANTIENFKSFGGKNIIRDNKLDLKKIFLDIIPDEILPDMSGDVVFLIDTTESMKEEIPIFRECYPELKKKLQNKIRDLRIGLILYKDYGEIYVTKTFDLTTDTSYIDSVIKNLIQYGGEDIPEAVNEAIYEMGKLSFVSDNRYAIIIGDAPAHPKPRYKITREDALNTLETKKIKLISISLPFR
ncbi:MAG TPA: vWA domain-containing protein [Spirochaetota bacterium]|mgnify:CR=1 FL=1|nr:vWA domain-containing protein [Spirochaetota bacterium]